MSEFFNARITHIYLFYGLGFFALGLAVTLEAGRSSEFRFANALRPLAAFGFLHSFHEWLEMFELNGAIAYGYVAPSWWEWIRLTILAVSFASLLVFGVLMLYKPTDKPIAGVWGGLGMLTLTMAGVLALGVRLHENIDEWLYAADAWVRYSLGVPAALLASIGMMTEWRLLRKTELTSFAHNFLWAGILFALYGLVGQTIAPHSVLYPSTILNNELFNHLFGFPIQLARGIVAALIAFFVIRGMRAFEVDRQKKLAAAQQLTREARNHREAQRGELLRRTVAAQEEERTRLARELHDDTLQVLTGLAAGLKGTEQLMITDPVKASSQLAQLARMSSHAISELDRLILNLRPAVLDDLGFLAAVQWYINSLGIDSEFNYEITSDGVECHSAIEGITSWQSSSLCTHSDWQECRLPAPVETTLFRIAQEALNNVVRHASATMVRVKLTCKTEIVELEIEDNGIGFDPSTVARTKKSLPGWGLVGIQERVELAGGQFELESAPGNGTRLKISVLKNLPEIEPCEIT